MNCCNDYGQCTQGRDCPVRTGKVLPHQLAHAAIVEANGCAVEGGNVWFAESEPLDLTPREKAEAMALTVLFAVLTLVVVAGVAGYLYARFFQSFT